MPTCVYHLAAIKASKDIGDLGPDPVGLFAPLMQTLSSMHEVDVVILPRFTYICYLDAVTPSAMIDGKSCLERRVTQEACTNNVFAE